MNHYGLWILLICIGPEVLMLVIEPLLLTAWGTTPGKKIFGLAVRDRDGGRLTYREGFWRTMEVLVSLSGIYRRKKGIGYREYYRLCREGKQNSWEEGLTYRIRDRKPWRFAVFTVSCGVLVMLGVMISVRANKPAHLGNISRMEYYDNCNQLLEYHGICPLHTPASGFSGAVGGGSPQSEPDGGDAPNRDHGQAGPSGLPKYWER